VGRPGRKGVSRLLPELCERYSVEMVGANVENSAGGFGVTREVYDQLLSMGIDFMTSGNHIWDKKETVAILPQLERLIRPANFSERAPGRGYLVLQAKSGPIAVLNLGGRIFMDPADDPFEKVEKILAALPPEVKAIVIDFHAEATSEKVAMGWYLDGRVSAVVGTHTHVPTADARVLPGGTAYITDVGMTGPYDGVIGVKKEMIIDRFLHNMPMRFEAATGDPRLCAVVIESDDTSGRARSIERLMLS
jgi:metallophosphoesterase (TIGR00282 family)